MTTLSASSPAAGASQRRPLRAFAAGTTAVVWLIALAAFGFEVALQGRSVLVELATGFSLYGWLALLAYGALGTALTAARPRNALGWIALGIAAAHGVSLSAAAYGDLALQGGWAGGHLAAWIAGWAWVPGYWAVPTFLLLLFPDGRLPSRRWWPALAAAAAGLLVSMVGWATLPHDEWDVPVDPALAEVVTLPFAGDLMAVGGVVGILSALAALTSLLVRHAHARGSERLQVRWVLLGGAAMMLLLAAGYAAGPAGTFLLGAAVVPLPAAIAVGVLRHRLWDVDLVIQRSVVYGLLTLLVLATYVATVSALGGLLGRETGAPLLATALVAVGVNPVRQRLQRWTNEILYGQRDDPYTALARLVERLDAAGASGSALDEAAETVRRVLRADHVEVEVHGAVRSVAGIQPPPPGLLEVPLRLRGEAVGCLRVALPARGADLEAGERDLLEDLARHIALAAHTEQLTADLRDSRRSLVEAREEERRRIRRDLHDELGPTLASVAMRIDQARAQGDPAALEGLPEHVRSAVRTVRGLVEDLRPAALDELGLAAALRVQVRQFAEAGLHVEAELDEELGVLSAAVDAAAYRIVCEALANAARHATASACRVTVRRVDGRVEVSVADDGVGLPDDLTPGVGLRSMRERAAEVGGSCTIERLPEGGTRVRAQLPVGP